MFLISHRGNINKKNKELENTERYIDKSISLGFDCEIDLWNIDNVYYLGHDKPEYKIDFNFLNERSKFLWIHCKNLEALYELSNHRHLNYFYHNIDDYALTSKRYIWTYPNKKLTNVSIAVLPEQSSYSIEYLKKCKGICSDYIENYSFL